VTRHYYFPRPYPNELVGSLLLRASLHHGVSINQLARRLSQNIRTRLPLLAMSGLREISLASDIDALQLLWDHTPFPYVTAYMSSADTQRMAQAILGHNSDDIRPFKASTWLDPLAPRYCVQCVIEDQQHFGETYWHREHNLPFVVVCPHHNLPLHVIYLSDRRIARRQGITKHPPKQDIGQSMNTHAANILAPAIAEISHKALVRRFRAHPREWLQQHRRKALHIGLIIEGSRISLHLFAELLREALGADFLRMGKLDFEPSTRAWPAALVRDANDASFSPSKHIMLKAFMEAVNNGAVQQPYPLAKLSIAKPFPSLDDELRERIFDAVRSVGISNSPMDIPTLLKQLGVWHLFLRHREKLPRTCLALKQLQGNPMQQRQWSLPF